MTRPRLCMVGGWDELYAKVAAVGADLAVLHERDKVDSVPTAGAGVPPPFAEAHAVPIRDVDACVALAARLHRERPFAAVVSFTEWGLESAAAIGARLGVRANPPEPVALTRDKLAMRHRLAEEGMNVIAFRRCPTRGEAAAFARRVGGPVILKPARGAGSAGVSLVDRGDQLAQAWERARAQGSVIAEAYVDGPEYSVDTMSADGVHEVVAVAEKLTTGPPHFVELGHHVPARLPPKAAASVDAVVRRFLDVIGQRHGPAHTEFKLVDDEMVIIESQTRTGGDQIWELNRLATGYDTHRACLEHLLHGRRVHQRRHVQAAAVRFFTAPPGRVVAVHGTAAAARHPGVARLHLTATPGSVVRPLRSSEDRLGYVVCAAGSVADAVARAEAAQGCVTITTA